MRYPERQKSRKFDADAKKRSSFVFSVFLIEDGGEVKTRGRKKHEVRRMMVMVEGKNTARREKKQKRKKKEEITPPFT